EVDDLVRAVQVGELLGQHDAGIARAATGNQRAESAAVVEPARKQVMVDLEDVGGRAGDQADGFVARVARRVGQRLVLRPDVVHRLRYAHYVLANKCSSATNRRAMKGY